MSERCPISVALCVIAVALTATGFILEDWHVVEVEDHTWNFGLTSKSSNIDDGPSGDEYSFSKYSDDQPVICEWGENQENALKALEEQGTLDDDDQKMLELLKGAKKRCPIAQKTTDYVLIGMYSALGFGGIAMILVILTNFGFLPNWISSTSTYIFCFTTLASAAYYAVMFPNVADLIGSFEGMEIAETPGLSVWFTFGGTLFALFASTTNSDDD